MQQNRVLLAHRDPAVRELAARALTRIGATLDIADDVADALARIAREPYGVVVIERDDAVLAALATTYTGNRPVVIVTCVNSHGLNPDIVSLVVPEPYDAHTLIGVILACASTGSAPVGDALPGDLTDNL